MRLIPRTVAALAIGLTSLPVLHAEHYKLFVLTGQSNSLGTTNGGEVDPTSGSDAADQHIKFAWHNVVSASQSIGISGSTLTPATITADFTTLQDQQGGVYGGSATHWGPEIDFARNLYKGGVRNFGVIKASRGGGGNTNWHKASGGHMYTHVVDTVTEATTDLTNDGHTFEIVGLLYLQGESDTSSEAAAAGTRFKELVDNLRVDLPNASTLHGVIAGVASGGSSDDTTRANHEAIANTTAYIDYFSNLDIGTHVAPDGLHFNKTGKFIIGQRFANTFFDAGVVSRHYGNLVFIGDSITQGGNGDHPSYRYEVFKNLANNNVANDAATGYRFVGSVTGGYRNSSMTTPDVNGQTFENVHDGHWGWRAFWENGREALPSGRYDTNNLGNGYLENWTGQTTTYQTTNAPTTRTYTGVTYVPDTVVMKIGINDISGGSSATQVRDDIATMIDQLRAANPNVRIHLCKVLYSNNVSYSLVDSLNALLPQLVVDKNAESSTSPMWLIDVNDGFNPSTMTYDNTHPNATGEAYVGARVSGGLALIERPLGAVIEPLPQEEKASDKLGFAEFEGSDIYNAGSYASGWSATSGITPTEVPSTDVRLYHPGGSADVLDGSSTGWSDINDGFWTVEARLKFDANPNGFVMWLGTGTHRILVEIHGDRVQDYGAQSFNVPVDNLDGEFHTYKVTHDPDADVYHVWRDGVLLTDVAGAAYDLTGTDERMLFGDYTSGSFGNGFDVTVDYINYGGGYEGNQIHNGTAFANGWSSVGGVSASQVNTDEVRLLNTTSGGSWLEGENTRWGTDNDGYWTFETRLKFDANPNGFVVWLEGGSKTAIIEIYGDRTQDSGGNSFNVSHNNLDGQYHVFRVGYDAAEEVYHVWRDGIRLTAAEGATPDASGSTERLIMGDYTGGSFGNNFDVTVDYIRTDGRNAFLPPAVNNVPVFTNDPILAVAGTTNAAYTDTLAGTATDADAGDTLTFSKVSGPAWLAVAADGALSGTPGINDSGLNAFVVDVNDGNGGSAQAALEINVALTSVAFSDDFESYDVENPSDLSVGGTATGNWTASNTASNATRTFNTGNYGSTRLWISNTNGTSLTSKGIEVANNTQYTLSAVLLTETFAGNRTLNASYDVLVGQTAETATSLFGGAQPVVTHGDSVVTSGSKEDHVFTHNFETGTLNPGDLLFVRFTRVSVLSTGGWFGVDDVSVVVTGSESAPAGGGGSVTAPVVATGSASAITDSSADIAYSITDDGGDAPAVTIYYGVTNGGRVPADWSSSAAQANQATGSYSASLSGLTAGTTYYFTLRASNSAGTTWGSAGTFTTAADASAKLVQTTVSSVSSTNWTTVDLGQVYNSAVIVATPIYPDTTTVPVVTRIRNASGSSFDLKIDRTDGLTNEVTVDVSVIAVEEGVYTQAADGVTMEAVKFTSTVTADNGSWVAEARAYQNSYTTPVVVGQVMSANDSNWSAFWSMGATRTDGADAANLSVGKHVGEDAVTTRADETIGYIVIESGNGTLNGVAYEAGVGAATVTGFDDSATPISYSLSGTLGTASAAALSLAGMDDADGAWAVLSGATPITTTALGVHALEDQAADNELSVPVTQASYLVVE